MRKTQKQWHWTLVAFAGAVFGWALPFAAMWVPLPKFVWTLIAPGIWLLVNVLNVQFAFEGIAIFSIQAITWALFALVARAIYIYFRPVTPIDEKLCTNCHYDLTGNVSGVCPECGMTTDFNMTAEFHETDKRLVRSQSDKNQEKGIN